MRDVLPEELVELIGDQYVEAVDEAESHFRNYQADEDAITGALGSSMDQIVRGTRRLGDTLYRWKTQTVKFRGRGPRAPESEYGADGIFEIEIFGEYENVVARKLIPFQAKKTGRLDRQVLLDQASRLTTLPGGGLVLVYGPQGYACAPASHVKAARGAWHDIPQESKHDFGQTLKRDFLDCRVGSRSLYYDASRERMIEIAEDGTLRDIRLSVRRRVRTTIERRVLRRR